MRNYEYEPLILTAGFNGWATEIHEKGIRAGMFGESDHAIIYEAQCHLAEIGEHIIPEAISDYLERKKITLLNPGRLEEYYQADYVTLDRLEYAIKQILDASKNAAYIVGLGVM